MADVTVGDGALQIELTVPERVVSLQGASVVVPLPSIRRVRVVRDILAQLRGLRTPGANFRGMFAIGTWHGTDDGRPFHDFVLVSRPGPGLVITTEGDFDRILLGTDEPEQFAAELGVAAT
jgi:hypothetical protein